MSSSAASPRSIASRTSVVNRAPTATPNPRASTTAAAVPMRLRLGACPSMGSTRRCPSEELVSRSPVRHRMFIYARNRRDGPEIEGTNVREVFQQELHEVQERLVRIADLVADA